MIKNEADRGWVAGLIEGEGCFTFNKQFKAKTGLTYHYPKFQLKMVDFDVVRKLADLLDIESIYINNPSGSQKQKQYAVMAHGDLAIEIMLTIRDLMGDRRRQKIDEILATPIGKVN